MSRRRRRIQRRLPTWSGLCPVGLHGLDHEGQDCEACAASPLTEEQRRRLGALKARIDERKAGRAVWSTKP
jgi:hypothetical protein